MMELTRDGETYCLPADISGSIYKKVSEKYHIATYKNGKHYIIAALISCCPVNTPRPSALLETAAEEARA